MGKAFMPSLENEYRKVLKQIRRLEINARARNIFLGELPHESTYVVQEREEVERLRVLLNQYESQLLEKEAESLGIEIPQKPDWYNVPDRDDVNPPWLNDRGRTMVPKQIRDQRRANVKWWIDLLIPILALLVAALASGKDIIIEVLKRS